MNKQSIRWLISFCALIAAFFWIDQSRWFQKLVLGELSHLTAGATTWLLSLLGVHIEQAHTTVITASNRFEIARSCTGSFVFMMFAAAVLPFPTTWKARVGGLFLGLLTLCSLNLLRTALIVLVASRFAGSLWTLHIVIGQVIVIVGMMGLFLWWARQNHQGLVPSFFRNNRDVLRILFLFSVGYLCGYRLYQIFLESSFGLLVKQLVEVHAFWMISTLNEIFFHGTYSPVSFSQVRLVEGCLSSPMVVVFVAIVFAWPTRWSKRIAIILLGFVPFFYAYHMVRAILISMTLSAQSKEVNLVYSFYGQILLCTAFFALVAYYWCSRRKSISYRKFLALFVVSSLFGALIASGLGWLGRNIIISSLSARITGGGQLSYDPEQVISLMLNLQVFVWLSLVGPTPGLGWIKKGLFGLLGLVGALTVLIAAVVLIETLRLAPHKGLLKFGVVLLPFAVYYWCFIYPKSRAGKDAGAGSREAVPQAKDPVST